MNIKKKIGALLCAFTLIISESGCLASEKTSYTNVFGKDNIIDVKISISEDNLADMSDHAANEEYHTADIEIDGVKVENIGIRTKGNLTLKSLINDESNRYSYRIKFNKYVKKQTYLGLDELCLNNGYTDPSYMREFLHYEALSYLGVNTPELSFCRVYINDELSGLYLAVEAIDDTFLQDSFGSDYSNGRLYKMEQGSSLKYEEQEQYSYAELKKGTDNSKEGLKKLIKKLNNISDSKKGDIENVLDVSSALKYIAANTVLCNYDSYNGNMKQNYYLFENKDGLFSVIPWDFNMSFGGFDGDNSQIGIDTPVSSGNISDYPLIDKLLSIDEYKTEYYSYIEKLLEYLENFDNRVAQIKALIANDVKNDPTAFYTYEEFEKATSYNSETDKNSDNTVNSDKRKGMHSTNSSILNCAKNRVENIKLQLSGAVSKSTEHKGFDKGHGKPENMDQPPQFGGENKPDGIRQPPQFGGENRQPPEFDRENKPNNENHFSHDGRSNDNQNTKNNKIRVNVNGNILKFETNPYIEDGRTLVPIRKILEALGLTVDWNDGKITVTDENSEVICYVNSQAAYVNGEEYTLDVPVKSDNGTSFVPVRFISECFGFKVEWTQNTKLIEITKKK